MPISLNRMKPNIGTRYSASTISPPTMTAIAMLFSPAIPVNRVTRRPSTARITVLPNNPAMNNAIQRNGMTAKPTIVIASTSISTGVSTSVSNEAISVRPGRSSSVRAHASTLPVNTSASTT